MSIPYTGVGGFFSRQGSIIGEYNRVAALYGADLTAGFQSIWQQFASSDQSAIQNLPGAVDDYRNSGLTYLQTLQQDASLASILQVSDYYSVVPSTLQQSLLVIAQQMVVNSQTIQKATITSTITPWASNLGDAKIVVSVKNTEGQQIDALYAETLTATCIASASAYTETFGLVGEASVPSNSYLWPAGSGANTQFALSNPAATGLLTDGDFEQWTGTGNNTPVNWTIVNGNAGVTVFRGTGGVRPTSSFTAVLTSDGSSTTALAQNFNAAINTEYAVSVQAKVSASDGSGTLVLSLTDDNGTVLQDDQGTNLSASFNMSAQVTTSFQIFTASFVTPRQLPTFTRFQVGFGVAPSAAKTMTLDLAGLVVMTQMYPGGPWIAGFSQVDPSAIGDYYSAALTNSLTSQSFALGMNRFYNTLSLGIYLPAAGSPTISDSLVTH